MLPGPAAASAVAVLLVVGGLGFAVLERRASGGPVPPAEQACDGSEQPAPDVPAGLPLGLPLADGATLLRVQSQGATTVAFARVEGGRGDIVQVRDAVLADLAGAGYRTVGTDQEPGYEAEAQVRGRYEGTVKVSPLCEGLLEVRYKIEQ